jgi:hypothetical protein
MSAKGRFAVKSKSTVETSDRLPGSVSAGLQPLSKAQIDCHTREVVQLVIDECTTDETVRLHYLGRELELRPIDTRRFVKAMSRFLSMN